MKRGEPVQQDGAAKVAEAARDTRRKAAFLLRKPYAEQQEVYALARQFFKAYLGKEYEFTADELRKELHKVYLSTTVREKVEALVEKLSLIEYTDTKYGQAEIKLLLQDLDAIVKLLVSEQRRQLPPLTRLANWLFRRQPRQAETVISEYPAVEGNDPVSLELNTLLEDIYAALAAGKASRAAGLYKKLLGKYNSLGKTSQQEFYHKVNAAYGAILRQGK